MLNNGSGGVTTTQTGPGATNIVNTGTAMLTTTNTGYGIMTVNNSATAAVTVTNTGIGSGVNKILVNTTGSSPITCTYTDGLDHTCTAATSGILNGGLGIAVNPNITILGSNAGAVTATLTDLTGVGKINVTNNGSGFVTATETGTGIITIVSSGAGVTATNNGAGARCLLRFSHPEYYSA